MKLTERLYKSVEDIWMGYLDQPFVKELAEGTLDVEKFRFYMIPVICCSMPKCSLSALSRQKTRN